MAQGLGKGLREFRVVMRGYNEDELIGMIEFGKEAGAEMRFIEYMDVGGATHWSMSQVFSREEILVYLEQHCGPIRPVGEQGDAPARRYLLADGTCFGIIASVTEPFCGACSRSRLTANGLWYLCLYAREGINLRQALRQGDSREEIQSLIETVWGGRLDRGAEERRASPVREVLYRVEELQQDPHYEMHLRGG